MEDTPFTQAKFLVAEAIVGLSSGLLMIFLMSRIRGEVFLGTYVVFSTWAAIFQMIASLGIPDLVLREMGKRQDQGGSLIGSGLLLCFTSSFLAMVAMVTITRLLRYPPELQSALELSSLIIIPSATSTLLKSGFIAEKKIERYIFIFIPEILLILSFNSYFIVNNYGIITIVITILLTRTASSLITLYVLDRTVISIHWGIHLNVVRTLLGPLVSFSITKFSVLAFWRLDIIMLSKLTSIGITGIYVTASKFLEVLTVLPSSFSQTIFPHLSRKFARGNIEQEGLEKSIQTLFYLVAPISVGIFIFARPIILTIFGNPYAAAIPALQILMVTFIILTSDMIMGIIFQAAGYQKLHMYISLVNVTTNIVLNFILIPIMSLIGACFATFVSISLSSLLHYYFISKKLIRLNWGRILAKPLTSAVLLAVPATLLNNKVHFIFLGIGYILTYAFVFFFFFSEGKNYKMEKI